MSRRRVEPGGELVEAERGSCGAAFMLERRLGTVVERFTEAAPATIGSSSDRPTASTLPLRGGCEPSTSVFDRTDARRVDPFSYVVRRLSIEFCKSPRGYPSQDRIVSHGAQPRNAHLASLDKVPVSLGRIRVLVCRHYQHILGGRLDSRTKYRVSSGRRRYVHHEPILMRNEEFQDFLTEFVLRRGEFLSRMVDDPRPENRG